MKLLLDTNIILCFQREDARLSTEIKNLILDGKNKKFISMASIWEVAIKFSLGKLQLRKGLQFWLQQLESVENMRLLSLDAVFDRYRSDMK
jgi:PIN domain nuclease of toxin-antitoxin system